MQSSRRLPSAARVGPRRHRNALSGLLLLLMAGGCWAPLKSPGISARDLPDDFRWPRRTAGPVLNYARLTLQQPTDYLLGANDILAVNIPDLNETPGPATVHVQVMANGTIQLPLVGPIHVSGLNLQDAQQRIIAAYADGFLIQPRISVTVFQKATIGVLVLGQVNEPGLHYLPRFENDVGHAIAAAGGLTEDAAGMVEVHRKPPAMIEPAEEFSELDPQSGAPLPAHPWSALAETPYVGADAPGWGGRPREVTWQEQQRAALASGHEPIVSIPLRGPGAELLDPQDIVLAPGDVVVVPHRKHEVFYVVGKLSQTNTVRFTVGDRERELGVGFVLPRDRELDVVTAVVMAGYIDPIDSPTTATVQRMLPDGRPLLIRVDLIRARYDPQETVLVQPGDIIYLNPDAGWWFRRTLDRVLPELITLPYEKLLGR